MMQTKLELKLEEGRNVNQELSRAREEKLKTEQENTRLRHRLVWMIQIEKNRLSKDFIFFIITQLTEYKSIETLNIKC